MQAREPSPPHKKFCAFGGKVSFATEKAAKISRETMTKYGGSTKHLRIYKCPNCYRYHLTSRPD